MPSYTTDQIRNLALVGQAGAGKTTLTEALLKQMDAVHELGSVEAGTTVGDHDTAEHKAGHSLFNSVVHGDHAGIHVNLIDTPGTLDLMGQPVAALPAVETVCVVINAANGLDPMARRLMQLAKERRLCRMVLVNCIDADHADLPALLEEIRQAFGPECLPINLPTGHATGVVDCFTQRDGDSDLGPVADFHTAIIDQVVEVDDQVMELYLEQGDTLTPEQLHAPFEQALRESHLVPVCFTAARTSGDPAAAVGVKELLDVIESLAPSPSEGNPRPFYRGQDKDEAFHAVPDPAQHLLAHVFAVRYDPFVGKLALLRVHQGTLTPQSQVFIDDPEAGELKKPIKPGHLFKLQGKEHVEVDQALPGDIVALAKADALHRDAVLHDSHDEDQIHYLPLPYPQPMHALAITPERRGDEQKLADALHRFVEQDPTFSVSRDATTHETVIHGLGELHLRVVLDELEHVHHLKVSTSTPRVAYRETIQKPADGHHRHKKQTGGAGQFGEVYLRVKPAGRGSGLTFTNDTVGGSIPQNLIPAIEKGVRQVMEEGCIAGYPMQDVQVSVYDGKYHPVDSKEIAFVTAGRHAFIDAVHKASPVLLEPMVEVEVVVPQTWMGGVTGELSTKRGRILGTDLIAGDQSLIKALVPLAEMGSFQGELKSITSGQGTYTMQFSHYEAMPAHLQQPITDAFDGHAVSE